MNVKQQDSNNELEQDTEIDVKNDINIEKQHETKSLKVTLKPVKLVSIQTKGNKQIKCCELSPSGELIVYSTDSNFRMLKLECVSLFLHFHKGIYFLSNIWFSKVKGS